MQNIFTPNIFHFPYLYKFPGQASDERILYVTREAEVLLMFRRLMILLTAVMVFLCGLWGGGVIASTFDMGLGGLIEVVGVIAAVGVAVVGWWWTTTLWKRSIAVLTNKRLIKFISSSPWNRHNLSLPLDMIVDTGAYSKGWLQALLGLGTFTARSSASSSGAATDDPDRINKKYFYIENVTHVEDLHHYLNKVLFVYRQDWPKLANFRPFLPHLKGETRKEFMKDYPEYWS